MVTMRSNGSRCIHLKLNGQVFRSHGLANYEADHRMFEVVSWVMPLKSAALNLQFLLTLED
jgi:hypothetical protein